MSSARIFQAARMLTVLVSAGSLAAVGPTTGAMGSVGRGEHAMSWTLAQLPGQRRQKVTRRTRVLRIQYADGVCSGDPSRRFRRVEVRRKRDAIVLTVIVADAPAPDPGKACPALAMLITKSVSLRGPLGARAVEDGSVAPPRVVVPKPTR